MAGSDFGGRVLQARLNLAAKRGRTVPQTEIAKAMGVSGVAIGSWESGGKEPSLETIQRLAGVLEVDPGWLVFGAGASQPSNGILVDVSSVQAVPPPEDSPPHGIRRIQGEPHEPASLPTVHRGGKQNRPVQKKPPS